MPGRISDAVIVITGASTGIGRAAALEFARLRAAVVVISRREPVLQRLAQQCETSGGRALAIAADVTDPEAMKSVARRTIETFGTIDVWINNAAVTLFGRLEDSPLDAYRKVIETNLFGYVHGARAVLPHFRDQGHGTLINISSVVGKIGQSYTSAYTASKFAIVGLSESLRMELADAPDIHVCTVLPASIDTPLFQHGANFSGRAVKPMEPVYSAGEVARALVAMVRHPRREVIVGTAGKLGLMAHAIAPGVVERVFRQRVDKQHFQERAAPPHKGNLFEPLYQYETVSGGWRARRDGHSSAGKLLGAAALALGVGLLVLIGNTRHRGVLNR
jgi:short-subunit dehydrogenase